MNKPFLTPDQIAKIVNQIEGGKNINEVARNYKISVVTLKNNLRRSGHAELTVATSPYCKRMPPELVEKAKQFMAEGMSQSNAARAIGFTPQALGQKLRGVGRPVTPPLMKTTPTDPDAQKHVQLNARFLSMPLRAQA